MTLKFLCSDSIFAFSGISASELLLQICNLSLIRLNFGLKLIGCKFADFVYFEIVLCFQSSEICVIFDFEGILDFPDLGL